MAVQTPFFGKRDSNFTPPSGEGLAGRQAPSMAGSGVVRPAMPGGTPLAPAPNSSATESAVSAESGGSKLTVGPNIKLKGVEITDCDTLVVEGTVEATMDSRVIHIAEQGAFRGCAEIDIAEIHGQFEGTLTVREKLVIFGTGKVSGRIRYGKVVIEEGGQLTGEISADGATKSATPGAATTTHAAHTTGAGAAASPADRTQPEAELTSA